MPGTGSISGRIIIGSLNGALGGGCAAAWPSPPPAPSGCFNRLRRFLQPALVGAMSGRWAGGGAKHPLQRGSGAATVGGADAVRRRSPQALQMKPSTPFSARRQKQVEVAPQ